MKLGDENSSRLPTEIRMEVVLRQSVDDKVWRAC